MVLFCPNIGILSTLVLSLTPLVRPFAWQSLILPVLPAIDPMLDLLEAPVPFILGIQVPLWLHYSKLYLLIAGAETGYHEWQI